MDIVERLNAVANGNPKADSMVVICHDAIAEIMRLRTTLEQVQQAMRMSLDASLMRSPVALGVWPKPGDCEVEIAAITNIDTFAGSFNDIKQAIKK